MPPDSLHPSVLPETAAYADIHGWLSKVGGSFPYSWQMRYFTFVASSMSLSQPEQLPLTLTAAWPVRTQESLSKASGHRGEGPRGSLRSVGAKLLACDPCTAAAGVDRLHCVCGQLGEPDPA